MKIVTAVLKILLLLILLAVLAFGGSVLAQVLGWPTWSVPAAFGGLIVLLTLILSGRKFYYRRKEGAYLKKVLTEGGESLAVTRETRAELLALRHAFQTGLDVLRRSPLELQGDPLMVQPWYLLLGPSGAGKTAMLDKAELASASVAVRPAGPLAAPTAHCDWRFCRRAVILDTAGRYTWPDNPVEDLEEWTELVHLLTANRPAKPLDGVVLTLPLDLIQNAPDREMEELAAAFRLRLEDLMAMADEAPPVFVMLTKADLLHGTAELAALLLPDEKRQALGVINSLNQSPLLFLADGLEEIIEELKRRRLALSGRDGRQAGALGLPGEMEALAGKLEKFFSRLSENPYQQPLNLRGLFFSASRLDGPGRPLTYDRSPFEGDLSKLSAPAAGNGLFLRDFFEAVLPGERYSARINPKAMMRRAKRRAVLLGGWLLILLGLLGWSGYSYHHVRGVQNNLFHTFPAAPALSGDFVHDGLVLSRFRDGIVDLESGLKKGLFGRLWLGQGLGTVDMLKGRFCELYAQAVLGPMNRRLDDVNRVDPGDGGADSFVYSYLSNLIWRLDLLAGEDQESLRPMEAGAMRAVIMAFGPDTPDISPNLGDMYMSYIAWRPDRHQMEREAILLRDRFASLMENRGLPWLFEWIIQHNSAPPVKLSEFWHINLPPEDDRTLSSSYTGEGRRQIEHLMKSLARLFPDNELTTDYRDEFWRQYHDRYYRGWLDLASNFDQGTRGLATRSDWLNRAGNMNTFQSPHLSFLMRMNHELSAIDDLPPKPNWAVTCDRLARIIQAKADEKRPAPLTRQLAGLIKDTALKTAARVDDQAYTDLSTQLQVTEALTDYLGQLAAFIPAVTSPEAGFILAQHHYQRSQSDPLPADLALADLTRMITLLGTWDDSEKVIWQLLEGPLSFLAATVNQQAAAQLNEYWRSLVVSPTVHVPQQKLWDTLFNPNSGLVPAFTDQYAQAFLTRDASGWHYDDWMGLTLPFTDDFFNLMNIGWEHGQTLLDSYDVSITIVPPLMNPPSAVKPNLVGLYLQCADKEQFLENYNYPAETTFNWKMGLCGDTTLMMFFDNFTARKTWPGNNGFVDFLNAFQQGTADFSPDDFPESSALMKAAGIDGLTIRYRISGAEDVRRDGGWPDPSVPDVITRPWATFTPADVSQALENIGVANQAPGPGEPPEGRPAPSGGGRP
ncbi:MAG: hypothetical protein LBP33_04965 [Candidatus Adiutrix sp.]|jgi:type VI secretion system protein ImpL|nr:hypothetical protein [Candidatus Adiutrix sp.]